MSRMKLISEFARFLIVRKKFWLIPLVVVLMLVGVLLVFFESSALSPFIYILF